jgi:GNAT superfamily N-acetyltransferase
VAWFAALKSACPRIGSFYLLRRPVNPSDRPIVPPGLHVTAVTSPSDAEFAALVHLSQEQGLDEQWCREQLHDSATACAVLSDSAAVGMGLVIQKPFEVAEVLRTFDPGPAGAYFFASYVTPQWRGKRIQRLLDICRAQYAARRAARTCYAIVETNNSPSLRAHAASGFRPVMALKLLRLGRLAVIHTRWLTPRIPRAGFTGGGLRLHPSLQVVVCPE